MKFGKIFRFEFGYQLHNKSTWLLLALFFLFGFVILRLVTLMDDTYLNAPATIAFFSIFGSAIWVVTGGVVTGDTATRDMQTLMTPLVYTSPISKRAYLGGRFLAALAWNALIMLALYAGFLLSIYSPGLKPQSLAPFRAASYLTNFGFIIFPTVLATTAIQYAAGTWSRRAVSAYLASVIILVFSQFGGTTVRFMLEWKVLGGLMDLLGTSLAGEMEGWTPIEKNTRLVLLEGAWLWNRVSWFGISVISLAFTYYHFNFKHITHRPKWLVLYRSGVNRRRVVRQDLHEIAGAAYAGKTAINLPYFPRGFGGLTYLSQMLTIAMATFSSIARSGIALVALLAIGTGLFATEYMEWLGVPLFARTAEVLKTLTPPLSSYQTQWVVIPLLTIFFAGELVWRERDARISDLTDITPVPEPVLFLGKFFGLALLITVWVSWLLLAGRVNQVVMGYAHFELGVYIKALFGMQLTNYLLFALLVLVIHVVVNQKYIGHIAAIGFYGFLLFSSQLGIGHHLLVYASDPGWTYSDMRGFEPFIGAWLYFKLHWISWASLLAVVAMIFWVRSKEQSLAARLHMARSRLAGYRSALVLTSAITLLSGTFIFYNTNILNHYVHSEERKQIRAAYEQHYGRFEKIPQPELASTKLNVEIYSDRRAADVAAIYSLVNRTVRPIDSIHISTFPYTSFEEISFDRKTNAPSVDEHLGYHIYPLKNPLAPGDTVQMRFKVLIRPNGFANDGIDPSVVANGTYMSSEAWMPVIGYDENRRLRDAGDRAKYGLVPRPERPSLDDLTARFEARHASKMDFEAIVGTSDDQVAVAPGALVRSWTKARRKYFHYATNAPIQNEYAIFSAKYAVGEVRWKGNPAQPVTIQVFYHPSHHHNVPRMLKSAQASLEYYSREFGPYPYSHFRVVERPGSGRGMHAAPMTIDYQEGYSLMNPKPGGLDLPYHIMSHEVAHQWWGLKLAAAAVEGAGLLVESLATYSAMQVVEKTLGFDHLLRYLSQMRQEYEVPHSRAAPPLLRSNSAFMNYRKGPFALFAMRNYVGKDRVNDALRKLLADAGKSAALPTTLDLYKNLLAVTPDSLHYLAQDLFATNTFWDLSTKQVKAKQMPGGAWQVSLEVNARKTVVDSIGKEADIPMNDWVEIGIYSIAPTKKPGNALYLEKHRLRSGTQIVTVIVPGKPHRAGIDPNYLLIDTQLGDNVRTID